MIRHPRHLLRDESGVTVIEFAIISPVLCVMLFGLLDLSHNMYTAEMLQGAIQKAARDSTLEGASSNSAVLDGIVTKAVHAVAPNATLSFSRKAYTNFTDAVRPEDYTDVNGNGTCDAGEPFEDANTNGNWDQNPGATGFGGARDAVLYSVTVNYKRVFPIAKFIPGQSDDFTLVANTILRNQPYGQQASPPTPPMGNCT
jgi:Flp pilus assembly protein TadG